MSNEKISSELSDAPRTLKMPALHNLPSELRLGFYDTKRLEQCPVPVGESVVEATATYQEQWTVATFCKRLRVHSPLAAGETFWWALNWASSNCWRVCATKASSSGALPKQERHPNGTLQMNGDVGIFLCREGLNHNGAAKLPFELMAVV
uniref:Uncharacterized protein n=1 Tax=Eutreptiella gymnastica TaxID=73025 RepID=A0A7S4D2F4_9EUGL